QRAANTEQRQIRELFGHRGQPAFQRIATVVAAGHDAQRLLLRAQRAGGNALPFTTAFLPGAELFTAVVKYVVHRHVNNTQYRPTLVDQRDVHGEIPVALDEFAGTVERVDQPVAGPGLTFAPG